jgi:bifunctional UDP-N-acetylglucosamine pyrophosphorylase/glucosamine-1-phosphate N-acetyltransferase
MTQTPDFQTLDGFAAVILAGGRGTRMRSELPKVLHAVAGVPMIRHVADAARGAGFAQLVAVVSPDGEATAAAAGPDVNSAIQAEPLGTGDAARAGLEGVADASNVAIVNADLPLLTAHTLAATARRHLETDAVLTLVTAEFDDPTGYGRIARGDGGVITAIVEEVDASASLQAALAALVPSASGELYLTDIVGHAAASGATIATHTLADVSEIQQVNDRVELSRAEAMMRDRIRERVMREGVTLIDPASTFIDASVTFGPDTTILPGVHLLGRTSLGVACRIGPNAVLENVVAGHRVRIGNSTIEESSLADDVEIGPYSHIRPGSSIENNVHLGNYVEVKASRIGANTRIGHFSYVGDADIGQAVNIGAGTVTANYDGERKYRTEVGDGAFIGVDSMLVAPIVVGAGARTAAGSVVTNDVPPGSMVMGVPARIRPNEGAESGDD